MDAFMASLQEIFKLSENQLAAFTADLRLVCLNISGVRFILGYSSINLYFVS